MDANGDEEEEDEEIDQTELQRRKERLEREQWIREQVCVLVVHLFYGCVHVTDSCSVL